MRNDNKLQQADRKDRIIGEKIILDGEGKFPKEVIILNRDKPQKYRIIKTRFNKYHFSK